MTSCSIHYYFYGTLILWYLTVKVTPVQINSLTHHNFQSGGFSLSLTFVRSSLTSKSGGFVVGIACMKVFDRPDNNKCCTPDQWCAVYNEDLKDGPQVKLCGFLHTLIFLWNIFIFTLQILLDDLIIYLGEIFKSDISRKMKNVFQAVIKYTVELLKSRNVVMW